MLVGAALRDSDWWSWRVTALAMVAMAALPLLSPALPPLVDLPGHMGRYRVELETGTGTFSQFYAFHWRVIGNLGVDLLIVPMAKLFGLELGAKLIVLTIPILTVAGMLWVAREVHGRVPPTALFALPLAYGHPFLFGFVNFALAMALALNGFAFWLWMTRSRFLGWRAAIFVPLGCLLWLTHTYGWAFLCILTYAAELVRHWTERRRWWLVPVLAGLTSLPLAPPLLLMLIWRGGQASADTGGWFDWHYKWLWLKTILRDRYAVYDRASVALLFALPLVALIHPRLRVSWMLILCVVALAVAFVCLPRIVFGSAYADMRLTPFLLAIAVLAVGTKAKASLGLKTGLALAGLAFVGTRMVTTTLSLAQTAKEQTRSLAALDHVFPGARVVSFVGQPCRRPWILPRNWHLGGMAIVRRSAFSNDQWAIAGSAPMTIVKDDAPGFTTDPSQMVTERGCRSTTPSLDARLAVLPRAAFDYVWLIDAPSYDPRLASGMKMIWHDGRDALYRITK